jgi:hypothetical protein
MPKAAMHKQCDVPLRKNKVRSARQIFPVKSKTETKRMSCLSDTNFRSRVLSPDTRHKPRSLLGR